MRNDARYEKNETVLWAFMPDGIMLHNFANRQYLELKGMQAAVWSYLDGAHSLEDIVSLLKGSASHGNGLGEELHRVTKETFEELLEGNFVVERLE